MSRFFYLRPNGSVYTTQHGEARVISIASLIRLAALNGEAHSPKVSK